MMRGRWVLIEKGKTVSARALTYDQTDQNTWATDVKDMASPIIGHRLGARVPCWWVYARTKPQPTIGPKSRAPRRCPRAGFCINAFRLFTNGIQDDLGNCERGPTWVRTYRKGVLNAWHATRLVKDSVLTSYYARLDRTENRKAGCIVSKWAYRAPKEAKPEQTYTIPYSNHSKKGWTQLTRTESRLNWHKTVRQTFEVLQCVLVIALKPTCNSRYFALSFHFTLILLYWGHYSI